MNRVKQNIRYTCIDGAYYHVPTSKSVEFFSQCTRGFWFVIDKGTSQSHNETKCGLSPNKKLIHIKGQNSGMSPLRTPVTATREVKVLNSEFFPLPDKLVINNLANLLL